MASFRFFTACTVVLCLSTFSLLGQQIKVSTTGPNDIGPCQTATFHITVVNISSLPIPAGSLTYTLPANIWYLSASGITEQTLSNPEQPIFNFAGLAGNEEFTFSITVQPRCNAALGEKTDNLTINTGGQQYSDKAHQYNIRVPDITLEKVSNWDYSGLPGSEFTRIFRLKNNGLGAVSFIRIVDVFGNAGLEYVASTPTTMPGNEMLLTGTALSPDGLLSTGESVEIAITYRLADCAGGTTTLSHTWGCDAMVLCNTDAFSYLITNQEATGQLTLTHSPAASPVKPCTPSTRTYVVQNLSSEDALNVTIRMGVSSSSGMLSTIPGASGCFPLSNFRIGTTSIPVINSGSGPYVLSFQDFSSDPDGPGGLEDLDNDGQYDDLAIGATINVQYNVEFDESCLFCTSINNHYVHAASSFTKFCGGSQTNVMQPHSIGVATNANIAIDPISTPLSSGILYNVCIDVGGTNSFTDCPNDSIIVEVSYPPVFTLGNGFQPRFNNTPVSYWLKPNVSGRLWILIPSFSGDLCLPFTTDCGFTPGSGFSGCSAPPVPLQHIVSAQIVWTCGDNACNAPLTLDCTESNAFLVDCPKVDVNSGTFNGVAATSSIMETLTPGFTDNTLTTRIDYATGNYNRTIAIPYDSVMFTTHGVVVSPFGDEFTIINAEMAYLSASVNYLQFLRAEFEIFDNETGQTHICSLGAPVVTSQSGFYQWAFAINALQAPGQCLADVHFTNGDLITLRVISVVSSSVPNGAPRTLAALRGSFSYNNPQGVQQRCGYEPAFFQVFNPLPTTYITIDPGTSVCDPINVNVQFIQINNSSIVQDYFPGVVKPLNVYKTIKVRIPTGFKFQSGSTRWSWLEGEGTVTPQSIVLPDPILGVNDTLIFIYDAALQPVTDAFENDSECSLAFKIVGECPSQTTNFFITVDSRLYFTETNSAILNIALSEPLGGSAMEVSSSSPISSGASGEWIVRVVNTGLATTPVLWVNTSNNATLTEATLSNGTPLNFTNIGSGRYELTLPYLASSTIQNIKIKTEYLNCQLDTVLVELGYRCPGRDSCIADAPLMLFFVPLAGILQISLSEEPAETVPTCSVLSYEVKVEALGNSPIFSPFVRVFLPPVGMEIVPGTSVLRFNGQVLPWADPVFSNGAWVWQIDVNQPPFNGEISNGKNFFIKFDLQPTCDYIDGSRLSYSTAWTDVCGKEFPGTRFIAPKIKLEDAPTVTNDYKILVTTQEPASHCPNPTLKVAITHNGGIGATQPGEFVRLLLPAPWFFDLTTIIGVNNFSNYSDVRFFDSLTILTVPIPVGLQPGDSVVFTVQAGANITGCSDQITLNTQATVGETINCNGENCVFYFVNKERFFLLAREKNTWKGQILATKATPGAQQEIWEAIVEVTNESSTLDANGQFQTEAFSDINQNGIIDAQDLPVGGSVITLNAVPPGGSQTDTMRYAISPENTCYPLIFRLTSPCACDTVFLTMQPPTVFLSQTSKYDACMGTPINVSLNSNGLSYGFEWMPGGAVNLPQYTYLYEGNLPAGDSINELVVVSIIRPGGCISQDSFFITTRHPAVLLTAINARCFNEASGSISTLVLGTVGGIDYTWSAPDLELDSLIAGNYALTITDGLGCTANASITVSEPPALVSQVESSNYNGFGVSCNDGNNGFALGVASGGVAPYSFLWSNGAETTTIGQLSSGQYRVTITDTNGCIWMDTVDITEPTALKTDIKTQNPFCEGGQNGSILVTVYGGVPAYAVNNVPLSTDTLYRYFLTAGAYNIQLTDNNGCTLDTLVVLNDIISVHELSVDSIECPGGQGSIAVLSDGNYAPYSFLWSNGSTQPAIDALVGGYRVTVTDANGCREILYHFLTHPNPISLVLQSVPVRCYGENTGSLMVTATGGTPPYTYFLDNASSSNLMDSLTAGEYSIMISDSKNCTLTTEGIVLQPEPVYSEVTSTTNVECHGKSTGQVVLGTMGGTEPYAYQWSNNAAYQSNVQSGLSAGMYQITVSDKWGCSYTLEAAINEPTAYVPTIQVIQKPCFGRNNGIVLVQNTPEGSIWAIDAAPFFTDSILTNITAGAHYLYLEDTVGCSFEYQFELDSTPEQFITAYADTTINLGGTATLWVLPNYGADSVGMRYYWYGPNQNCDTCQQILVNPLATSLYKVVATDKNGCRSEQILRVDVKNFSLYVPNVFSPNSVDSNGLFTFNIQAESPVQAVQFEVFDRWGSMCYQTSDYPDAGWDGTVGGRPLDPAVFAWKLRVDLANGETHWFKGDVTLIQ